MSSDPKPSPDPLIPVFDAVLFDCDGVLVDSEPITHRVLRELLAESGWDLTLDECVRHFIGRTVRSQAALIESHTGHALTDEWMTTFYERRNAELSAHLKAMPGAHAAVQAALAVTGGRIACASGADRDKLRLQLEKTQLASFFGPHVFSGQELPNNKPAPDVYLAAAASLGVLPARCLVIEDTFTGAAAGVAAGAMVWGLAAVDGSAADLRAAGAARLLASMGELPALLGVAASG